MAPYLKWVKIVNLQASQSSDNLSHFLQTQIQYLTMDLFRLIICCFGFFRQTMQLIFLCCEFVSIAHIEYSIYFTMNNNWNVSFVAGSLYILGTIHILRHHIFGIFGPPSPPTSADVIYEWSLNSKCHCNAHFALLLPQLLFLDSCHVFVVYFAGSKLENQAGLYQARIHQALSRIGTISASALKISNDHLGS